MKTIVKRLARDEKGAALVLALILLLVGGLISAALLGHMGAGLLAGEVYGRRTVELYAADAGVEDAIWKIQNRVGQLPCSAGHSWSYNITDADGGVAEVNDKWVEVTIKYVDGQTYRVLSTATGDDTGTAIEAYISFSSMNFSALLDHAIVSYDTIGVKPGDVVNGDVWLPDEDDLSIQPSSSEPEAVINGTIKDEDDMTITWPTYEQLSTYYLNDVDPSNPYPFNSIDIEYTKNIGPCYIEGDFVVDNTGDPDTLVLDGTVYVAGDLEFRQSGSHGYTIDLNGHTIFAEGGIYFPSHRVSISGSGCIIARGDIFFHPGIASGGDDFVLVMSIAGIVDFQPSGDFTGCVAGNLDVQLQPNCTINWISPDGKGLDFPGADGGEEQPPINIMKIESWEIIQQ
jgi:Flp pilus assembly pilin Flp